ncbi:PE-PPE domain-containing protein, partial [Mycolicibacter kumamotonensis]
MVDAVAAPSGGRTPSLRAALGAVTLVAGLSVAPQLTSPSSVPDHAGVLLSAGSEALAGSNVALIMGPSMIPTPSKQYADTVDALFLQPRGFAGELEVLTTPASPYNLDSSLAEGAQILVDRVQGLLADGQADAEHPVTVFGYSQSAALTTLAMQQLNDAGVPPSAVHFVLIGDSAYPNGGMLVGFANMPGIFDSLEQGGVTLGNPTPNDLYPTDI